MKLKHEIDKPKPGSDKAVAQGCKCPVVDNFHGEGRGGSGFEFGWYVNEDCPIHGVEDAQAFFAKETDEPVSSS